MEDIIRKKQPFMSMSTTGIPASTTTPSPLAMHKDSQTISKVKPKVRIIHIFAPEIIKTDVENFRELVQRLTGKPAEKGCKRKPRIPRSRNNQEPEDMCHDQPRRSNNELPCHDEDLAAVMMSEKGVEIRSGYGSLGCRDYHRMVKEEEGEEEGEEMWNGANSGGFLGGFADLDGFIQELGEFPMLPVETANHHSMHGFGAETTQLVQGK